MFCRFRRKIKQSDGRNQFKRKLLICNSLLAVAKRFSTTKEYLATAKLKPNIIVATGSPQQRSRLAVAKRFV